MGKHTLATKRRRPSLVLAACVAPAAVFFAAAGDVNPLTGGDDAPWDDRRVVAGDGASCCWEVVTPAPNAPSSVLGGGQSSASQAPVQLISATRYRMVQRAVPRLLPVGMAPEQGLQIKTILAARSISARFPEVRQIGGVRPDALRWHPEGLAVDLMIPNPSTAAGIALGDEIVAYALENAKRFGLRDAIWRGTYYTPDGARAGGYGHYDHVHLTTTGGGYPTGAEVYFDWVMPTR